MQMPAITLTPICLKQLNEKENQGNHWLSLLVGSHDYVFYFFFNFIYLLEHEQGEGEGEAVSWTRGWIPGLSQPH